MNRGWTGDWAVAPEGLSFGRVTSVAVDHDERLYVLHRGDPPVLVFDREGQFVDAWGHHTIRDAHGLSVSGDRVYVVDRSDCVSLVFTLDGRPCRVFGARGNPSETGCTESGMLVPQSAGPFNYPTAMVHAPWDRIYIADGYRNARIHEYSSDGELLSSWGEPGSDLGQFHLPHGLLATEDGHLLVCDRENNRIQRFTSDGEFSDVWTDLHRPTDIAQSTDGRYFVSELAINDAPPRISVMSNDGELLERFNSRSAHGLCTDTAGHLYLALSRDRSVDRYVIESA